MGEHLAVAANQRTGVGYGVVEAVVDAPFAGTIDGVASMIMVRVLVAVLPQVSVEMSKPAALASSSTVIGDVVLSADGTDCDTSGVCGAGLD